MCNPVASNDAETGVVIGVAMDVHRTLGCGFPEQVYQEAFAVELMDRGIPFQREVMLPVKFKGRLLRVHYRVDFICFDRLLVELKALPQIGLADQAQMISYLKAAGAERGLVLSFGGRSLAIKRLLFSEALHQAIVKVDESDVRG